MASDILFPFYDVLVNSIFGSIGLAIIGIAVIITLILFLCRTGWTFVTFWMIFYFMVMGVGYIGSLALVFSFFIVTAYASISLLRLIAGAYVNI